MATFDPKNPPAQDKERSDDGVRAGDYLLVLASFQRRTAQSSRKAYLRGRFEIIHGPAKGGTFFDSISIDMDNKGAMFRLALLAEQCGATEPFDLESDSDVRAALVRKPFKARVNRTVNGQYVNNGIERYLGKEISESERRVMDEYLYDQAEQAEQRGGHGGGHGDGLDDNGMPDDVPPPSDEDFTGGPPRGRGGRKYDDDLPF